MRMRKGFIDVLLVMILAVASIGVTTFYARQEIQKARTASQTSQNKLGASIQTQLTDTLGTFRTNVNTNFTTLDAALAVVTTTIATYGTIVTVNSPVPTANGGTATTTAPSANQILSANGTSPAWKTLIIGAGLNVTSTASTTQIGTAGFDNTANISFTGNNTFANSSTFNGLTTFATTTIFNATTTFTASTTIFNTVPLGINKFIDASSSPISVFSTTATTTIFTVTVNSSTMAFGKKAGILARVYFDQMNALNPAQCTAITAQLNGTNFGRTNICNFGSGDARSNGYADLAIYSGSSTNTFAGILALTLAPTALLTNSIVSSTYSDGLVSFTPTSTITITLFATNNASDPSTGLRERSWYAQYVTQ